MFGNSKLFGVEAGKTILNEGDKNPDMFKIISGHAEVYMGYGTDKETLIGIIGPQTCFGEFGILIGKPSIYTVIAYSKVLLLRITTEDLGDFIQQNHNNVINIMENMARSMLKMRTQIDLLLEDLKEGIKPDEKTVHEMEKTIGEYSVYRNSAMSGKFWTKDSVVSRRRDGK